MSPGATFERVYHELKRMLAEGELSPGTPIEPALIGKQIASSITPVRDALHRLTGERLVEAPNHNGFRVPLLSETALRDLFSWNGVVLQVAAKRAVTPHQQQDTLKPSSEANVGVSIPTLFLDVARSTGSLELTAAVASLNARLAVYRRAESKVLDSTAEELSGFTQIVASGDRSALAGALRRYHRRRLAATPHILVWATAFQKK